MVFLPVARCKHPRCGCLGAVQLGVGAWEMLEARANAVKERPVNYLPLAGGASSRLTMKVTHLENISECCFQIPDVTKSPKSRQISRCFTA